VVYVLTGILAVLTALGERSTTSGHVEAVQLLRGPEAGPVLLALVGAGLLGYALWRLVEAVLDPEGEGGGVVGVGWRIGGVASAVSHAALGLLALQWSLGWGSGSNEEASQRSRVAAALSEPWGAWAVAIVGIALIIAGLSHIREAVKADFRRKLRRDRMSAAAEAWVVGIGRFGLAARGVVFPIIGGFLIKAALQHDPSDSRGLGGALREIASQPFGTAMLLVVALGLVAYGIHALSLAVFAAFRRADRR
jgi:hypothetical protein